ncbi:MAG: poly-beta-1,6-N-acetyl-D-glucosamine biosynthesis protein PgaD [Gammaproteobacteria bacterium]|nr:poly-beta-1,6-N-acetyl-D-glucosamine biosynthesis protein PgaD [Gammaproteobacteria bacterium]MBU1777379.1 poly-beta-1,6-N-acetyl-D-glucosamine biosynthesis protein PgaD [Gammaproteobacteria bacterium]
MNRFIIDHPEWQKPKDKYVFGFITLGFWMLWIYLWLPLLSLLAWILGFKIFHLQMIEMKGYEGLLSLLGGYLLVILLMSGSLYVWASYNIYRFSGMSRRVPRPLVSLEAQAKILKASPDELAKWQQSQMIIVEHGKIHAGIDK